MAAVATSVEPPARTADRRDPWARVWWWSSVVALALVVALAVTGALLWFSYRPTAAQAWDDLATEIEAARVERRIHEGVSRLLLPVLLLVAVSGIGARWRAGRRLPWPVVALAVGAVASFTGSLLAWDQLALWAVTTGTSLSGMQALWSDHIRFVLVDGVEVSPATIRRWAVVHVVVGMALVAAVLPRRLRT